MIETTCMKCNRTIKLTENPSGLVFDDSHFVCEKCCTNHSDEEILNWTKTVMKHPSSGMPIALWLIHEHNKDKTIMTNSSPTFPIIDSEIDD